MKAAVGRAVRGLRVVAVESSIVCGHCHPCRIGRGNLCENLDSFCVIGQNGGCAESVAETASHAFVMPAGIPRSWGPLIEPVSFAIHGFDRLAPRIGDHVLVHGEDRVARSLGGRAAPRPAGRHLPRLRSGRQGRDGVILTVSRLQRRADDHRLDAPGFAAATA